MKPAEKISSQSLPHLGHVFRVALVFSLVFGFLFISNVPGERRELERTGSEWAFVEFSDHGWPFTYLTRRERFDQTPHPCISIWQLTTKIESFSPLRLVLNIVVVLLGCLPVVWLVLRTNLARPVFRWQLSLGSLLFATALGGMALAATIFLTGRYREHQQFVTALRQLKAWVSITPGGPDWLRDMLPSDYRIFDQYDGVDLPAQYLSPVLAADEPNNSFVRLCECPEKMAGIKSLRIVECKEFTDKHLAMLGHARNLDYLDVSDTGVNGEGFARLSTLRHLQVLRFSNAPVTDTSLRHLSNFPQLRAVGWLGSNISPEAGLDLKARYSKWGPK